MSLEECALPIDPNFVSYAYKPRMACSGVFVHAVDTTDKHYHERRQSVYSDLDLAWVLLGLAWESM